MHLIRWNWDGGIFFKLQVSLRASTFEQRFQKKVYQKFHFLNSLKHHFLIDILLRDVIIFARYSYQIQYHFINLWFTSCHLPFKLFPPPHISVHVLFRAVWFHLIKFSSIFCRPEAIFYPFSAKTRLYRTISLFHLRGRVSRLSDVRVKTVRNNLEVTSAIF